MDAVNLDYIASVIDPANHTARQSTMEDLAVGISSSSYTFPITSNSEGNVGVYIFPD